MATYATSGQQNFTISNLQLVSTTSSSASFTWASTPGATSYYLYLFKNNVAVTPGSYLITSNTSYTIHNLDSNSSYTVSVTGCNVMNNANQSNCGNVGLLDFVTNSQPTDCVYGEWEDWGKCKSDRTQSRIKRIVSGSDNCPIGQYDERGCGFNWKLFFLIMFTVSVGMLIKIYRF